jgi:hypothetical protein
LGGGRGVEKLNFLTKKNLDEEVAVKRSREMLQI